MKRQEPKPYEIADATIKALNKLALDLTQKTKSRLLIDGFDDLNVLQEIKLLYKSLDRNNRKAFKKLYRDRFCEMYLFCSDKEPDEDFIDELVDMELSGILSTPNELTLFAYNTEVNRKRDRAIESIIAAVGKVPKQIALDKAIKYWTRMGSWYCDIISDEAAQQAMKRAGIKRVMWQDQNDGRVCSDCAERNGQIYPIDKIPAKPHLGCRCVLRPVL